MRSWLWRLLALAVLAAGTGGFLWLRATRPQQPPAPLSERVWRVAAMPVRPARARPVVHLYGRVEAPRLFRAAAPAVGWVRRVAVREGDWVEAGRLLVALDPADFTLRVAEAEGAVAELEAQLETEAVRFRTDRAELEQERRLLALAREALQRASRLRGRKLASQSDLDEAQKAVDRQRLQVQAREEAVAGHPSRVAALEARLKAARARLGRARLDAARSRVEAPFAGRVAEVPVAAGARVAPGTLLVSLYAPKALEVRARLPAPLVPEVRAALAAGENLEAEAGALRLRLARLAGQGAAVGVDGLFMPTAGAGALRPGEVFGLRLHRREHRAAVAVPAAALYADDKVYLLRDGRLHGLRVEVLGEAERPGRLLISAAGLAAGDVLVTTHLPNAVEGLRVEAVP